MAFVKRSPLGVGLEERRQRGRALRMRVRGLKGQDKLREIGPNTPRTCFSRFRFLFRVKPRESGTARDGVACVFENLVVVRGPESAHEGVDKPRKETQRPSEKPNRALDRTPAGEPSDRLLGNRVEDRPRDFALRNAGVQKCHDVGLCKDPAARGHRVTLRGGARKGVKPRRIRFQKRRHLVDKGPGSARAGFVHAKFDAVREEEKLRVFAPEFDRAVELRRALLEVECVRHHLLHEGRLERLRKAERTRAREENPNGIRSARLFDELRDDREERTSHVALMPHVRACERLPLCVEKHVLDGSGSEIDAKREHLSSQAEMQKPFSGRFMCSFFGAPPNDVTRMRRNASHGKMSDKGFGRIVGKSSEFIVVREMRPIA